MGECKKCMGCLGGLLLVLGLLFLLRDLGVWNFWNIQWWTALFLLVGVGKLAKKKCADCNSCKVPAAAAPAKKKKKR